VGNAGVQTEEELKQALRTRWKAYNDALARGDPDQDVDQWIHEMGDLVPHGNVSDLLFWGEKERADEEVFEEAIRREFIWRDSGEVSLLVYIEAQLAEALTNPDLSYPCRNYAEIELPRVRKRIASLSPKMAQ
jgi:hypothetical protein